MEDLETGKEILISLTVTPEEAIMLQKLRKYSFGKFIIHKMEGRPVRVEINASELIKDNDYKSVLKDLEYRKRKAKVIKLDTK